jgi:hypothetical protein
MEAGYSFPKVGQKEASYTPPFFTPKYQLRPLIIKLSHKKHNAVDGDVFALLRAHGPYRLRVFVHSKPHTSIDSFVVFLSSTSLGLLSSIALFQHAFGEMQFVPLARYTTACLLDQSTSHRINCGSGMLRPSRPSVDSVASPMHASCLSRDNLQRTKSSSTLRIALHSSSFQLLKTPEIHMDPISIDDDEDDASSDDMEFDKASLLAPIVEDALSRWDHARSKHACHEELTKMHQGGTIQGSHCCQGFLHDAKGGLFRDPRTCH